MRLINVHSLELKEFHFETAPEYVALSHRWGDDEINYEDFINKNKEISTGYKKIAQLCEFVKWNARPEREVSWAWVDSQYSIYYPCLRHRDDYGGILETCTDRVC